MEGGSNGRAVNGINRNSKFRSGNEGSAHAAPPSGVEPGSGGVPSNAERRIGVRSMARSGLASTSSANKFHEVALAAMFALRQDVGGEREGEGPGTWGRMSVEFFKRAHRRSIGMAPLSRMNHSSGDMVSTGRQPANSVRERPKSLYRVNTLAEGREPSKNGRSWLSMMQVFPENVQSRRNAALTLLAAILIFWIYVLATGALSDCSPARPGLEGPCAVVLASGALMTASLAVSLALLLVPRTAHGTHRFLPWISAFAWVMVASCEAAALWALWDPDTRPMDYLEEARIDAADPERHIERSLAVAFWVGVTVAATAPPLTSFFWPLSIALLAQLGVSAATLSADADLKRGPDHGWDAHGPALVGVLAAYAVLGPMGAFLVDTTVVTENATVLAMVRWAHAAGCCKSQRSCGGVSWLLLFSSGVFHCLMASLLAAGACALSGVAVPAWVVVLLLVALAVLVRLTGHMRAVTAITALDEALTSEVADAVMTRAIQDSGPPVRNTANITGETGAGAAVRGTIEEESRRIKPGDSLAKASSQRKLAAWEQAVMTHVPDLPYLREVPIVSVVFTDVVGYTSLSSTLEPKLVLKMLHEYFSKLDALMDIVGAFKYQTVGDSYVVIAGYPNADRDHALTALRTGYAMVKVSQSVLVPSEDVAKLPTSALKLLGRPSQRAMALSERSDKVKSAETSAEESKCLQIRVGVHTGPLASSTLGFKRNCLTLVGDTLNTASRMESNSRPGHMRISEATYNLLPTVVKSQFTPEMIEAKGKGTLQTWIVDCQQSLIGV